MMFEFASSGGAVSQKRLHQNRSILSNCLVVVGGKFKHQKFLESDNFGEANNIGFDFKSHTISGTNVTTA